MYALFVLSVHVYYVNCNAKTQMGYLCALIKRNKNIKTENSNTSACADDVTINTYSDQDAQILLDIAADFANQERYELQPSKTNIVRIKPSHRLSISGEMQTLLLNDSEIHEVEQVTHIGLEIANTISNAAEANVENNIKKPGEQHPSKHVT